MSPFHRTLLTVLALAAMPLEASAQTLYKSVGADGRIVYSDKPPVTGAVEKPMKLENLPVSVVSGASPAPQAAAAPDAPPAAIPRGEVVLYMATWCGYCKAAKAYLASKGIAYRQLDIDTPSGKAAFSQLGARGVPVLLTNGQKIADSRHRRMTRCSWRASNPSRPPNTRSATAPCANWPARS